MSGTVRVTVGVIEDLGIDGPVLLPNEADLPFIAQPYTDEERSKGRALADRYGIDLNEDLAPIQVIGSGQTINDATENAFECVAELLTMDIGELRSRCTFTGDAEIGQLYETVQLSLLAPPDRLRAIGIEPFVRDQYNL